MAVVGAYVAFSKLILETVPVFLLASIRFGVAALVMLPWTFPSAGLETARAQCKTLFLQSLFGNFLFSICMLSGVARTSATAAGIIMSTLPAVVALFSYVTLKETMGWKTAAAIALAFLGVTTLTLGRGHGPYHPTQLAGNLLMVGAVCCEALYVVLGKQLTTARVGPMQISAWINLIGFALMLPFGLCQAATFDFDRITLALWGLIVLYALAASIASTWLWLSGLRWVPANQAGVFTIALPISAAAVGVLFMDEVLGVTHLVAFLCALCGLVLVMQDGSEPVRRS